MSDTITLTQDDLDSLIQRIREEAIQAVVTMVTPVAEEPSVTSERAKPALDLSDSQKVARMKVAKSSAKFWGDDAHAPASFRMRKRIAAFADLKTGGTAASDRVFRGPLTKAQATTASAVLESGRSIRLDDLEIDPR